MSQVRILEALLGYNPTKVESTETDFGIEFLVDEIINLRIFSFLGNLQEYSLDQFEVAIIRTLFQGERQISSIRFSGQNTRTIGYLFPIASLRTGEELSDNKWTLIYASAAIRAILFNGVANKHISLINSSNSLIDLEITSILPEDLALMVLGKEQLSSFGMNTDGVKLMLQAYDYYLYPEDDELTQSNIVAEFEEKLKIKPLASCILEECSELLWIISAAKREKSLPAKFLGLYQVIEHFLSKVFYQYMNEIADSAVLKSNPWLLREKITEVVTEKWRLNRLQTSFLNGADYSIFRNCTDRCNELLASLGEADTESSEGSWAAALYKVRNLLIHRQISMVGREEVKAQLTEVCESLLAVCFELLAFYDEASISPLLAVSQVPEPSLEALPSSQISE